MKIELLEDKNILAYTFDNGVSLNFLIDSFYDTKEDLEKVKLQYRFDEGIRQQATTWSIEYAFNITNLKVNKPILNLNLGKK